MKRLLALATLVMVGLAVAGCGAEADRGGTPSVASRLADANGGHRDRDGDRMGHEPEDAPTPALSGTPTAPPDPGRVTCPAATTTVSDTEGLKNALAGARPGDSIALRDGTYTDTFETTASGTAAKPIFLCGGTGAVLDGDGIKGGYVLHLDGASYWRLVGFTVRNGQKGLVADRSQHSIIQGLTVTDIGDEAIHLRTASSDNVVAANHISHTGQRRDKFGEGVYVGSAQSNWCRYTDCKPDESDRNLVRGNVITDVMSEAVDIKEGTVGGALIGNTFDGGSLPGADSSTSRATAG